MVGGKLRWIVFLIFLLLLSTIASRFYLAGDKNNIAINEYVVANQEIGSRLGAVKNISVIGLTSFEGAEGRPPYKMYRVKVEGDRGEAVVILKVVENDRGQGVVSMNSLHFLNGEFNE